MAKEMLINVSEGEECRIAILEDGKLQELYMERTSSTSHVGNIYKGRVMNVEPSIQAAFIDFGLGRNGFLHISDLMPTYFGRRGEDIQETVGRKMARRDRPPIQHCLRRGDEIIVQIIKEGIGTKGPTLSSYLSIPGRILVMMPGMSRLGVSRKIEDEAERRKLRTILDGLKPPKDVGFIIRTAGIGKTKTEIQRDFTYLTRLWTQIEKKRQSGPGAMELYAEGDLVTRTVRDVFSNDVERIVVDNREVAGQVSEVIKLANPRSRERVELYEAMVPLFSKYGIEREIEQMYSRHVPLPSGGSLVIDSTEAVVAIDVNSGKFRDHSDAETTAFKTDIEAADEIPRQLKLRDLGGVIICDFIDLRYERHRRELDRRLQENFKDDRARTKVLPMSDFGIIELTRQRMRPSLKRSIYFDCPHCKGGGLVKTQESMTLDVMRRLAIAVHDAKVVRIELSVCPDVAFHLQNRKRAQLANLESAARKRIVIKAEPTLGLDEQRMVLFDAREGLVFLAELGMAPAESPHGSGQGRRDDSRRGGRRGRDGRRDDRRNDQRPAVAPTASEGDVSELDRYDIDNVEDEVDRRDRTMEEEDQGIGEEPIQSPQESRESQAANAPIENIEPPGDLEPEEDIESQGNLLPQDDIEREDDRQPRDNRRPQDNRRSQDDRRPQNNQRSQGNRQPQDGRHPQDNRRSQDDRQPQDNRRPRIDRWTRDDRRPQEPSAAQRLGGGEVAGHGGPEGSMGQMGLGGEEGEGGGRRRRRRRGGRGRGRRRREAEGVTQGFMGMQPERSDDGYRVEDEDRSNVGVGEVVAEPVAPVVSPPPPRQLTADERLRQMQVVAEAAKTQTAPAEIELHAKIVETATIAPPQPVVEASAASEEIPASKGRSRRPRRDSQRRRQPAALAGEPGSAEVSEEAAGGVPSKRRRAASGRRGGSKKSAGEANAKEASSASGGKDSVATIASSGSHSGPVTIKTGSADRHLIADEPVIPEPPRRPRTYRDLDEIADDME